MMLTATVTTATSRRARGGTRQIVRRTADGCRRNHDNQTPHRPGLRRFRVDARSGVLVRGGSDRGDRDRVRVRMVETWGGKASDPVMVAASIGWRLLDSTDGTLRKKDHAASRGAERR